MRMTDPSPKCNGCLRRAVHGERCLGEDVHVELDHEKA